MEKKKYSSDEFYNKVLNHISYILKDKKSGTRIDKFYDELNNLLGIKFEY